MCYTVERSVRIREVEGSNPFRSTKQVLDEHLLFQRRLRREMFALIHNRKAASWEESQDAAFCYPHIRFTLILRLQYQELRGITTKS